MSILRIVSRVLDVETEADRRWKRAHGIETRAEYRARHQRMEAERRALRSGPYLGRDGRLHTHKETPEQYWDRKINGRKYGF